MIRDIVPLQTIVLVPMPPDVGSVQFSCEVDDETLAQWETTLAEFQRLQGTLAAALKDAQERRKTPALIL